MKTDCRHLPARRKSRCAERASAEFSTRITSAEIFTRTTSAEFFRRIQFPEAS